MTTQLIPVVQSAINNQIVPTVDARQLHSFLEVGKDFSSWMKAQIKRARLVENREFVTLTQKGERKEGVKGASISIEYALTIEAGKHIAMMSGTDKGVEVRDYFLECERQAKQQTSIAGTGSIYIDGVEIRRDDKGRFCLRDLHQASGGDIKDNPMTWRNIEGHHALVHALAMPGVEAIAYHHGLDACVIKELVYDYATWVSAPFLTKVVRALDGVTSPAPVPVQICNDPIIMMRIEQLDMKQQLTEVQTAVAALKNRPQSISTVVNPVTAKIHAAGHTIRTWADARALNYGQVRNVIAGTSNNRFIVSAMIEDGFIELAGEGQPSTSI